MNKVKNIDILKKFIEIKEVVKEIFNGIIIYKKSENEK